jgi:uncharacterized protein
MQSNLSTMDELSIPDVLSTPGNLSMQKVLSLIFIPAALLTLTYVLVGHLLQNIIPSLLLFFLLAMLMLLPIQFLVVVFASKKEYGSYSLKSAFVQHQKLSA